MIVDVVGLSKNPALFHSHELSIKHRPESGTLNVCCACFTRVAKSTIAKMEVIKNNCSFSLEVMILALLERHGFGPQRGHFPTKLGKCSANRNVLSGWVQILGRWIFAVDVTRWG